MGAAHRSPRTVASSRTRSYTVLSMRRTCALGLGLGLGLGLVADDRSGQMRRTGERVGAQILVRPLEGGRVASKGLATLPRTRGLGPLPSR